MSDNSEEFKLVTYNRRNNQNKNVQNIHRIVCGDPNDFNKETIIRRINDAKQDIILSDFYQNVKAAVDESLLIIKTQKSDILDIICLGLGRFSYCMSARYQLALLSLLKDHLKTAKVKLFDPAFSSAEKDLLIELHFEIFPENYEGKYKSANPTLYFLPHCPKQLSNNLLWANWNAENLKNSIIIANSFNKIIETTSKRVLLESANYIWNICPHVAEVAIINSFKYFEIFNDLAIHVFNPEKLALIDPNFWQECTEPVYKSTDIEYITGNNE